MIGAFQAATRLGVALFVPEAVAATTGLAYANVMWLCQTFQQIVLGLIMLSVAQLSFKDITERLSKEGQASSASASL
jgi:hypothetical protein